MGLHRALRGWVRTTLIAGGALALTQCSSSSSDPAADACKAPLSRDCATRRLTHDGWLQAAEDQRANVFSWPEPIAAGSVIEEGLFREAEPLTVSSESWLYYVDLEPGALFGHPTQYLLVNRATGEISVYGRYAYPEVDGEAMFALPDAVADETLRPEGYPRFGAGEPGASTSQALQIEPPTAVDTGVPKTIDWSKHQKYKSEDDEMYQLRVRGELESFQSAATVKAELGKCVCATPAKKKVALVVNGGELPIAETNKLVEHLTKAKVPLRHLDPDAPDTPDAAKAQTSLKSLAKAFEWLAGQVSDCCDEVLIYVTAHGSPRGSMAINPLTRHKDGTTTGSKDGGSLSTKELEKLLDSVRSCRTKVVLHSCFGGAHLERGLNVIDASNREGCMCRTVAVGASARQSVAQYHGGFCVGALTSQPSFDAAFEKYRDQVKAERDKWGPYQGRATPQVQSTDCVLCEDPDGDGLYTGDEWRDDYSDPEKKDSDGDGLDDAQEKQHGTNPNNADTDGDKLNDGEEVGVHKTDPKNADTDGDGANDKYELFAGTDPNKADSDGDGLNDWEELTGGTNPNNPDEDGDGLNDKEEKDFGSDPKQADADGDKLNDAQEKQYKTNPNNADSDGDGLSDYDEVTIYKSDPNDPMSPG